MPEDLDGIKRAWGRRLACTGRIAASAARLAARRIVGASGEADGRIGESLARELDSMKGMAMKVGQILSYFDGVLPEDTHRALRQLQHGAKPVAFDVMAQVVEEALGRRIELLFEDFQRRPVAAASIGQVHRARYRGRPVAVKIQYPGIAETMQGDFSRLDTISRLATIASAVDGPAIVAELRESMSEECDYLREAVHQDAFAAAVADDSELYIPQTFPERCAATVLTSEWCDGRDFYTLARAATQAEKNAIALALARFAYRCLFGLGTLNADPHPGNYLFPGEGRVVLLDFGCVRRFSKAFVDAERRVAQVVIDDRRDEFRESFLATNMVANAAKFDFDFQWEVLSHQYAPYRGSSFRFTTDYVRRAIDYGRPSNPNLRQLAIPPPWIWLQRLQWGLHAVLARLDAEGDFGQIMRETLATPWTPLEHGD